MRPGPRMASRVRRRADQPIRGAVSPWSIVPSAPRMSPTCALSRCAPPADDSCARTMEPRMVTSSVLVFIALFLESVHCHGSLPGYRRHSELEMDPPAHHVYGPMPVSV